MQLGRILFMVLVVFCSFFGTSMAKTILFLPHDSRPISSTQTAENLEKMGYKILMPPRDILGSRDDFGDVEKIFAYLEAHAHEAERAVLSMDSLLYGSLVASRKHDFQREEIFRRLHRLENFAKKHPHLKIYAFGSIMRTPRNGYASGTEDASYYKDYGAAIFRYTALLDKKEVANLSRREKKEFIFLKNLIPRPALDDWLQRRNKNFLANQHLIELARKGVFSYLALGRDDNAPYSMTHMESRHLSEEGRDLGKTRFQAMAGIDELAMLLLTRAVNDDKQDIPFIHVIYNEGTGRKTIPSYSDEEIEKSVKDHVLATGSILLPTAKNADLLLLINTDPKGKTFEAAMKSNDKKPTKGTLSFLNIVTKSLSTGKRVAIADISHANGADNALLEALKKENLLFQIHAYAGWNTPTNSMGFVLGEGILSRYQTDEALDELLLRRYLDDWAYEANVRQKLTKDMGNFRHAWNYYVKLGDKKQGIEERATILLKNFARENLPPFNSLEHLQASFPWDRLFEVELCLDENVTHKKTPL